MKFGKEFVSQIVPEWQSAYVDYIFLKKMLKDMKIFREREKYKESEHNGDKLKRTVTFGRAFSGLTRRLSQRINEDESILVRNMQQDGKDSYETMFLMAAEEGAEFDVVFFKKLDQELNKVNAFYRAKVEEILNEADVLDKQMNALLALKAALSDPYRSNTMVYPDMTDTVQVHSVETPMFNVKSERYSGPTHMEVINEIEMGSDGSFQGSERGRFKQNETKKETHVTQRLEARQAIQNLKINITPDTPSDTLRGFVADPEIDQLNRGTRMLGIAFIEFHRKLRLVKSFSSLNLLAFAKIMKKYDKITGKRASCTYLHAVENSFLGSCEEVSKLLGRVETTYTKHFTNGNHRKAIQQLRPMKKREKHRVAFFIGLFSGGSIALIIGTVFLIRFFKIYEKQGAAKYMDAVFPLYSMLGYIVLHLLMYAADIFLWLRYRINYPFIFGFKSGTELGYRHVLLISMGIALFSLAGIISNLNMETKDLPTIPEIIPLILMLVLLVILFCPFKIFYYSSRLFLLRSAFHCICAPFYKVLLPDFFLADQLTSQVPAIREFLYFACYYGSGAFKHRETKFVNNDVYEIFFYIVAIIPYWSRFLQCIRRFSEERDPMQGYNAMKYFSTIVAVVFRTAYSKSTQDIWKYLSIISSIIATVVSLYWDIIIDWGLLQKNSRNPWLREKIVISQKYIYFLAIVVDVLFRFAWMQTVLRFNIPGLHVKATTAIFACMEIVRRGIWNFFRIENEHLNNVGKFRAFKSVPLPFQYVDDADSDD